MLDIVTQLESGQVPAKERQAPSAINSMFSLPTNLRGLSDAKKQLVKLQFYVYSRLSGCSDRLCTAMAIAQSIVPPTNFQGARTAFLCKIDFAIRCLIHASI